MYVIYKDYDLPEINFAFNGYTEVIDIITVDFLKKTYLVIWLPNILPLAE